MILLKDRSWSSWESSLSSKSVLLLQRTLHLVPNTHFRGLTVTYNSSSRKSDAVYFSVLQQYLRLHVHVIENKTNL